MKIKDADAEALVGRAFRCPDGLIRWITTLTTRGYYHLLWLNESDGVWHHGYMVRASKWEGGEEVRAPQPGESYRLAGVTGVITEYTVAAAQE